MTEEPEAGTWRCLVCEEEVESSFDVCWNCGANRQGEKDFELISDAGSESLKVEGRDSAGGDSGAGGVKKSKVGLIFVICLMLIPVLWLPGFFQQEASSTIRNISVILTKAALLVAIVAFLWVYIADIRKNPESSLTGRQRSKIQGLPLCPNCLSENQPEAHFCVKCQSPLSSHAAIDPLGRIQATGDTYRKAIKYPSSLVVFVGMWLLFGGMIFFTAISQINLINEICSSDDGFFYYNDVYGGHFRPWEIFSLVLQLIVIVASYIFYLAVLLKYTSSYIRKRRRIRAGLTND